MSRWEFPFEVDPAYRLPGLLFGVTAHTTNVVLTPDELTVRFGPWHLRTPVSNIASTEVTGPYSWLRTVGPAHLSFTDHGVTFATTSRRGLCLSFVEPVRAIDPLGLVRHPGATVTVLDPEGLAAAVEEVRRVRAS